MFGDSIVPTPERREFPAMLEGFPSAQLAAYQPSTVIAEKFEALVQLDEQNSRMKDFFDLRLLLGEEELDHDVLIDAIRATFARRRTPLPNDVPTGLTDEFAVRKASMWGAFLQRNKLVDGPADFVEVVRKIRDALRQVWTG